MGDFGKYALLRLLCGKGDEEKFRLGVVWYFVRDETHNDDGKHIRYLKKETGEFRDCDPELYFTLRNILIKKDGEVITENRKIAVIENSGLLGCRTLFHGERLVYGEAESSAQRLSLRKAWHERALEATAEAQLVFMDPDNGIERKSVGRTRKKGPKYVFWEELEIFAARQQSLVVYHHFHHLYSSLKQVTELNRAFCSHMPQNYKISSVIFRRGTRRVYFIAAHPEHWKSLSSRLNSIHTGPWSKHFEFSRP